MIRRPRIPRGVATRRTLAAALLVLGPLAAALLVATCPGGALAGADPRLAARLDPRTVAAVEEAIGLARARGLPSEPLVARALEGASRSAPGPRIVTAVRNLAAGLERARDRLGAGSTPAELVAGAAALAAGVRGDTLAALRTARGEGSVVVPLVVLADLVTRRVPVATASRVVLAAARAGVGDADLMRLRERVGDDIRAGVPPGNAALVRTRHLIGTFDPPEEAGARPGPGSRRSSSP